MLRKEFRGNTVTGLFTLTAGVPICGEWPENEKIKHTLANIGGVFVYWSNPGAWKRWCCVVELPALNSGDLTAEY